MENDDKPSNCGSILFSDKATKPLSGWKYHIMFNVHGKITMFFMIFPNISWSNPSKWPCHAMCIGLPDVPKHAETLDIWFHDGGNGHRGNDAGEGHQGQLGRHGHASVKPRHCGIDSIRRFVRYVVVISIGIFFGKRLRNELENHHV